MRNVRNFARFSPAAVVPAMAAIPITREEFQAKYQLLKEVTAEGARSFHAVSSSGAVVMVHLFESGYSADAQLLLAALDRLEEADQQKILRVHDVEGTPVVVTRFILDFSSLPAWVAERAAVADLAETPPRPSAPEPLPAPASPPSPPPVSALFRDGSVAGTDGPPPPSLTGEVRRPATDENQPTRGLVPGSAIPPATADPVPASSELPTAAAPGEPISPPGEFTRMFKVPSLPAEPQSAAISPAPQEPTDPPPIHAPGDSFTGIFRAATPNLDAEVPAAGEPPPWEPVQAGQPAEELPIPRVQPEPEPAESIASPEVPPDPPASAPGSFTQIFQSVPAPIDQPAVPRPANTQRSSEPAAEPAPPHQHPPAVDPSPTPAVPEPGEFTRMFRSPVTPPSDGSSPRPPIGPSAEPAQSSPFSTQQPGPPAGIPPHPASVAPTVPPPREPGEFTRVFLAADLQPPRPVSPEPPRTEAGAPTPSWDAASHRPPAEPGRPSAEPPAFRFDLDPARPSAPTVPNPPPPASPPSPPAQAGEFTQIFGRSELIGPAAGSGSSTPPPAAAQPPFAGGQAVPPSEDPAPPTYPPAFQATSPSGAPPATAGGGGASEFTRIIAAAQPPTGSPPAVATPSAQTPAPAGTALPNSAPEQGNATTIITVVGLAVVLLILVAIILYFVFRTG